MKLTLAVHNNYNWNNDQIVANVQKYRDLYLRYNKYLLHSVNNLTQTLCLWASFSHMLT